MPPQPTQTASNPCISLGHVGAGGRDGGDQQLEEAKQRQADITKANSSLLRRLGTLRQEQQRLEDTLNASQSKIMARGRAGLGIWRGWRLGVGWGGVWISTITQK